MTANSQSALVILEKTSEVERLHAALEKKQQELVEMTVKAEGLICTPAQVKASINASQADELKAAREQVLRLELELSDNQKVLQQTRNLAQARKAVQKDQTTAGLEEEVLRLKLAVEDKERELAAFVSASTAASEGLVEKYAATCRERDKIALELQRCEGDLAALRPDIVSRFGALSRAELLQYIDSLCPQRSTSSQVIASCTDKTTNSTTAVQQPVSPAAPARPASAVHNAVAATTVPESMLHPVAATLRENPRENPRAAPEIDPPRSKTPATERLQQQDNLETSIRPTQPTRAATVRNLSSLLVASREREEAAERKALAEQLAERDERLAALQQRVVELMEKVSACQADARRAQQEKQAALIDEVLAAVKAESVSEHGAEKTKWEEAYNQLRRLHEDEVIIDSEDAPKGVAEWINETYGRSTAKHQASGFDAPYSSEMLLPTSEYAKIVAFHGVPYFDQLLSSTFDLAGAAAVYAKRHGGLLVPLTMACLLAYTDVKNVGLDVGKLEAFLHKAAALSEEQFRPYSNSTEAAFNVHMLHTILASGGAVRDVLGGIEIVGMFVAVACSNIFSYGATAKWVGARNVPIANVFEGEASQQQMQLAVVNALLTRGEFDFLAGVSRELRKLFALTLSQCILVGLVPAQHRSLLASMRQIAPDPAAAPLVVASALVRFAVFAVHARPTKMYVKAVEAQVAEMWLAGDFDRNCSYEVSLVNDRMRPELVPALHSALSQYIVRPLLDVCRPWVPKFVQDRVAAAFRVWVREGNAADTGWAKLAECGVVRAWEPPSVRAVLRLVLQESATTRFTQTSGPLLPPSLTPVTPSLTPQAVIPKQQELAITMTSPVRLSPIPTVRPAVPQSPVEPAQEEDLRTMLSAKSRLVGSLAAQCSSLQRKVEALSNRVTLAEGVSGASPFAKRMNEKRAFSWVAVSPGEPLPVPAEGGKSPGQVEQQAMSSPRSIPPMPPWAQEGQFGSHHKKLPELTPLHAPEIHAAPGRSVLSGPVQHTLPTGSRLEEPSTKAPKKKKKALDVSTVFDL